MYGEDEESVGLVGTRWAGDSHRFTCWGHALLGTRFAGDSRPSVAGDTLRLTCWGLFNNYLMDSTKNNLSYIHFHLGTISYYNKNFFAAEESLIEDWDFYGLLNKEWAVEILSNHTFELLTKFRQKWLGYKNEKYFDGDSVFMSIDPDWKNIVTEYLVPTLQSMESDFDKHEIEYVPILNSYNPDLLPPIEAILQRGSILHKLLLENKIITKNYIKSNSSEISDCLFTKFLMRIRRS